MPTQVLSGAISNSGPHSKQIQARRRLFNRLWKSTKTVSLPHLQESRCGTILGQSIPNFLLAAESATYDAGLLVGVNPDSDLPQDMLRRLFHVVSRHRSKGVILPIEFKSFNPTFIKAWRGLHYTYSSGLGQHQRRVGLVIIWSPVEPEMVIVGPRFIFLQDGKGKRGFYYAQMPVDDHDFEAFPPVLAPLAIPISYLPQAVKEYETCWRNPAQGWRSPFYKNVVFYPPAPFSVEKIETLMPSDNNTNQDAWTLSWIQQAFDQHSKIFKFDYFTAQKNAGDFMLIQLETDVRIVVEMKRNLCSIDARSRIRHLLFRSPTSRIFTPFNQWDYLFTVTTDQITALLVSRDRLPEQWFIANYDFAIDPEVSWQVDPQFIKRHSVVWDRARPELLVQGFEHVLAMEEASSSKPSLLSQREWHPQVIWDRPYLIHQEIEYQELEQEVQGDDDTEDKGVPDMPPRPVHFMRGTGHSWSMREHQKRWQRKIKNQCVEAKFGSLHFFGLNPSGSFTFSMGIWNRHPTLAKLKPDTQCIFVNIVFTRVVNGALTDHRRPGQFFHATHGTTPSIYIMIPYEQNFEDKNYNVYIVPSGVFNCDKQRLQYNEKVLTNGWKSVSSKNEQQLIFNTGYSHDAFMAPENDIVKVLKLLYRKFGGQPASSAVTLDVSGAARIDMSRYFVTYEQQVEQVAEVLSEQTRYKWETVFQEQDEEDRQE